ncbi:pentapeptide repeat-containing protein [Candidatus Woesearchaeota archaeon]|nr:pentapeptide repeat-containing protein [Candidatus Woesearchaeota archaeon]
MNRNYRRYSSNVDAFNWARKQRGAEDYYGLNLSINLRGMNLPEINFEKVNLSDADLNGANFEGANLRKANFDYTFAGNTVFRNADLRECSYLYKLNACGANFENADLRGTNFRPSQNDGGYDFYIRKLLRTAHFSGTKITSEQREQLIAWFGVPESDFESRFLIVPRGKYRHGPNSYFYEKGQEAYEQAKEERRIFTEKLNGNTLKFAIVPVQGNEDLYHRGGYAFSLCRSLPIMEALLGSQEARYKGKWLYFVFDDVPEQFREFAAVHEFGERVGGSHKEAIIMEFERARSKGMLDDYLAWMVAEHSDKLIGDAVYTFAKEGMGRLPRQVIEATESVMPKSVRAWKRKQETEKNGLPFDIWKLAWKGLLDDEIVSGLVRKGYDVAASLVEYWKEQMEIPNYKAIQKLTYLEPR